MGILDLGRKSDSGDVAGVVSEIACVNGAQSGRIITAVRTGSGRLKLISWKVSGSGSISRDDDSGDEAGEASSIDIARGSRVVTACRTASGNLRLISWNVDANGTITRVPNSDAEAGAASVIKIVAVTNTLFVTACRAGDGNLRLISWRLNSNGTLARVPNSQGSAGEVSEISLIKLPLVGTSERLLTAVRTASGTLKLLVWGVSSAGAITRLGNSGDQAGAATLIRSVLDANGHVVTSVRDGGGNLKLITWEISPDGLAVRRLLDSGAAAGGIGDNSLVSLPDGVISAVRTTAGDLRLIAWSTDVAGAIRRRGDSGKQAGTASRINLLPVTGVGGVTMVTAFRTATNNLKLIAWGPACVRLHVKIVQAPVIPINTMVASMRQVYGSVGIGVQLVTTETLNLPGTFLDIDVGGCFRGSFTIEQEQLFSNRNNVGPNDVVVYFVRSTVPPFNGCATHPPGRPGAVVAQGATQWTMAHEVGHVLGLNHLSNENCNDPGYMPTRLMTGCGTARIINLPPDLVASEVSTMQTSRLTTPC